jgi:F-type H+-transporting ATPase subunit b
MLNLLTRIAFQAGEVEHAEPSGLDLVLPEINELIAGVIAFTIVFVFIWKWGRPAISRTLTARQEAITGQLTAAEATKHEAESLLLDYKKQLAGARDEANKIVDDARRSADALRTDVVGKAEADAESIVRKAREEAAGERERAVGAIRHEVASLSLDVAQRVVGESVDAAAQKKLVDRYIEELEGLNA